MSARTVRTLSTGWRGIAAALGAGLFVAGEAGAQAAIPATSGSAPSPWTFTIAPYGWLTFMSGPLTVAGQTTAANTNAFETFASSQSLLTVMGAAYEVAKVGTGVSQTEFDVTQGGRWWYQSSRKEYIYFDDGNLVAYRDERFKYNFTAQFSTGISVWHMPLTSLHAPMIIDLQAGPFEYKWMMDRTFLILPAVEKVAQYMATYREFPPRQRPASFSIDQVMEKVNASTKTG